MRSMLRRYIILSATAAFALGASGYASAALVRGAGIATQPNDQGEDVVTFPARPAAARELPPSRIRVHADVDWGVADPRAVAAFRASRMFAFMRAFPNPQTVVHAGQGYYVVGSASATFGAYANHVVYPKQREPGSPNSGGGFLYAPTMFGPGNDCIEATTVVQNADPQVWAWDWCAANPNPYAVVVVNHKFKKNYIRKMPDKLKEFSVETILASDGVTWDMALYNYSTKQWDVIYQTSGPRNPNYGLGQQGWDFFETYTNVVGSGMSDVCTPFPGPIASDQISISFDDQTFTPITASDSQPLQFNSFHCTHFSFSTPAADEWEMQYH